MIPISETPPAGVVDRRDGSTKGECGITTLGNLFCKDQISASSTYVKNYDKIKWAGDGCKMATCPKLMTRECWRKKTGSDETADCPIYQHWRTTGKWEE